MHVFETVRHTTKNLVNMQQPEGFFLPAAYRPLFSVIDVTERTGSLYCFYLTLFLMAVRVVLPGV